MSPQGLAESVGLSSLRLGAELRRLRKKQRVDRSRLSRQIGLSAVDLARIERGELLISLDRLCRLLESLGVDRPAQLLDGLSEGQAWSGGEA